MGRHERKILLVCAVVLLGMLLAVRDRTGPGKDVSLAVSPFPVRLGQVGPIADDNPRQHPFACRTQDTRLGQPVVDNDEGIGFPVRGASGKLVGFSRDCGAPTIVEYFYKSSDPQIEGLVPLDDPAALPAEVATVRSGERSRPYLVRYERGTINRFIYSISLIAPGEVDPDRPDLSAWNGILVFWFGGGVGIGHQQASDHALNFLDDEAHLDAGGAGALNEALLEQGYAIATTTGAVTSTTYHLPLTGQTAAMVKEQFVARYGAPRFTFGVGGSGGAIQQLIYEQNRPDLLDGLIVTHAYPDQITQTISVGDCELLEYYFDVTDARVNGSGAVNPKWRDWEQRRLIEGMNAINGFPTEHHEGEVPGVPLRSSAGPGSSECIEAWRGLTPRSLNPRFVPATRSYELLRETEPAAFAATPFSFFDDLVDIFGSFEDSPLARNSFDNVGVQYGLGALLGGKITVEEFLLLNRWIGGWKDPRQMVAEGDPFEPEADFVSPWSHRNGSAADALLVGAAKAPRSSGSSAAIEAAYAAGLVFRGDIEDPVITLLPYLEAELDMHNSRQPFSIRERLREAKGPEGAQNQVIIASDGEQRIRGLALKALGNLETWAETGQRPAGVMDACLAADGSLIGEGADVWAGVLSDDPLDDGVCSAAFPIFKSARIVAGDDISDDTFKCVTISVDQALEEGFYGEVVFTERQLEELRFIFDEGVCDYSREGVGVPSGRKRSP